MTGRRPARPREDVFAEAMAAIAEHGLAALTMAALGRRLGMSGGHLLYYFGSKDQLLLETLRWSEGLLGERRRAALDRPATGAAERLDAFTRLYLPEGPGDPRWTLWLEVWTRSQAVEALRAGQREITDSWHRDLTALLAEGSAAGEFRALPDPGAWATRYEALLDGLAVPVVAGVPGTARRSALTHARAHLADTLLPPAR